MSEAGAAKAVDEGALALAEFIEALSKLKSSGLLGIVSNLGERSDEAFLAAATDPSLMRVLSLLSAASYGLQRVDAEALSRAQNALSDLVSCGVAGLGRTDLYEERRLGALGAANMLRDPNVSATLGVLVQYLKAFGSCVRSRRSKR